MRKIAGWVLSIVSLLMVVGFFQVGTTSMAAVIALVIGAGIPGVVGVSLLTRGAQESRRLERMTALRRQTIESEIIKLAGKVGGKLTVVEVVAEMAIAVEEARAVLDSLVENHVAEIQVSDSGGLVYDFPDVRLIQEKGTARGVLDD